MCKCSICSKEYEDREFDGIIRNIDDESEINNVCMPCFKKAMEKHRYWFRAHIPGFVEGVPITLTVSENENHLIDCIKKDTREGYKPCSDFDNTIVNVKEDGSTWWVRGYLSKKISASQFPNWKSIAKL